MAVARAGDVKRVPSHDDVPAPGPAGTTREEPTGGTGDPEVALMLRVQAGEEEAFAELFRRLSPRVLQYVRRLVGSDAQAEEVTQDVFVQMFRFRHRYQPQSRLSTWVFTIATNLCLNELRRPERKLRVDLADAEHPEGPVLPDLEGPTPEVGASTRELARRLEAAIAALPPKQRAALLLSRMDGLAYKDVGDALECSEGAVKALIFRATQALKQQLKDFLE